MRQGCSCVGGKSHICRKLSTDAENPQEEAAEGSDDEEIQRLKARIEELKLNEKNKELLAKKNQKKELLKKEIG